jgi:glycosyltransferase involved in cell wall biosynthesis
MRLLLVTDSYPPLIGGADRQVQMLAHAMHEAGAEVTVATSAQPGLPAVEDDAGVAVHRIRSLGASLPWASRDPGRRHHPPFPDPVTSLALWRLIRRSRPDLVHSYGWITYSAAAALTGSGIPLVVSARDYGYVCGVRNLLHVRGEVCSGPAPRKCLRCATGTYTQEEAGNAVLGRAGARLTLGARLRGAAKGLVAVGGTYLGRPLLRRHLRGLHSVSHFVQGVMDTHLVGPASHLPVDRVIPSFLPPAEPGRPHDDVPSDLLARLPDEPFILFVGALLPQKGIWPLLRAYERLRSPAPPLVLLGPASWKSPATFPSGVLALGAAGHADVMAAWDRALLGVVPSVGAETFGNVVTEAMSRGRAVVASRLGGIVDIIEDEVSGLLVAPGDDRALAAGIQRLIDDPVLRERLGAAAAERVQRFAADRVLPQFEDLYRDILALDAPDRPRIAGAVDGRP